MPRPPAAASPYVTNDVAVTVTPPAIAAPVFTNRAAFATPIEVEENQSAVRGADYFAASDTNTGNLTLGGADAGRFTLSGSGTLTFNDPPNFEMPRGNPLTAGNTNDYALTITAVNSTGTTPANFTVRVTDEIEPPSAPTGLAVVSATTTTVTLEWNAAVNMGPPITAYQLRYFVQGGGPTPVIVEAGVATTVIVTGLTPGTRHDFDVRATNEEGSSSYSTTVPANTLAPAAISPAFAAGASIADQSYIVGLAIDPMTLPAVATPGNGATTYMLTPAIPGLTLNPTTRVLTGTPMTAAAAREYTYMATDTDDGSDTLTFNITVEANTVPAIVGGNTLAEQNYIANVAIDPLTLPAATGGNGARTYALDPPTGLTFNPATRVLTGTPTTVGTLDRAYRVSDSDADTSPNDIAVGSIRFTVRAAATGFTVSVVEDSGNTAVSTITEGDSQPIRVLAVPTPAGSAFAVDQTVTFTATAPPAVPPANAADPYVAYTAVTPGTIALGATQARAVFSHNLATTEDALDHADFPVTFTATASPSNVTGTAMLTLLDDDIGIRTSVATVSVTQGETATYNVQLGEQPPASATVSVVSQTTANATVSPATLTFSTANWNMAQPVVVTGVLTGSANIRHAAPASGGFTYVTNDVAVTVTPPAIAAPVFTNRAAFATPIEVEENQSAVRGADYFAASDTNTGNLTLGGADAGRFTLSGSGTLTFNDPPNFEMPRGNPLTAGNTNDYALTVTAVNSTGTTPANFTVRVTDANDLPVLDAFTLPTFTEYTTGTITFTATDEDRPAQTLSFSLAANTVGATMTTAGVFTWTPREADGGEARTFTVMVTDNVGSTPVNVNTEFTITANELPNRAPTGATITAASPVTAGSANSVTARATDEDTDTLTYTWSSSAADTFSPATGATVTWTPANVATATPVTLTVVVTDGEGGSVTATAEVSVNPMPTAPVFNNSVAAFTVVEGNTMVGAANQFAATGTGLVTLTLGGTDAGLFTLTASGNLTFNTAPDFEMPRGMPLSGTNVNNYPLTATATASSLSSEPFSFLVRVSNANEAPVLPVITPPAFEEYTETSFDIPASDVDSGDTLAFSFTGASHGATLTAGGTFTWTPGENDGGMVRTFGVRVQDDGGPPVLGVSRSFAITATELPNRAPTGATITGAPTLVAPATVTLEATAMDADTGTTLTYTWAVTSTEGGSISPVMGASTTYTPPTLAAGDAARTIDIMLTVSDGDATTPLTDTATHTITVNPPVPTGTAPAFTNKAQFTTAISVAENTTAVGAAEFFAAPGSGTVALTLGGADAARFAITAGGTLTFATAPDFEMPRSMALDATSNNNNYALTVAAMNTAGSDTSGLITVTVTDENEAPVLSAIPTPTFTEYTAGGFTIGATDVDAGQTVSFALTGETHGATITTGGGFAWTPREMDGTVERMFTVEVTDSGTPPQMASVTFAITAAERPNQAPTVTITTTAVMIANPRTLDVTAEATDPDTGDMLTYTWSSDASGDSFSNGGDGASVTWTPPTVETALTVILTVVVTDDNGGTVMATDEISVLPVPDTAPAFTAGAAIPAQTYIAGSAITPLTLPAATGGNGDITYTLTNPPVGLTFDTATRVLTGTPTTAATMAGYAYTAADSDATVGSSDETTLTLTITVDAPDTAPAFTAGAAIPAQTYIAGSAITPLTLPVATGGNGAITYTLTPPAGLSFDPATRVLTGTPTTAATMAGYAYTAADSDATVGSSDEATLTLTITIEANTPPAFSVTSLTDQSYLQGSLITPLTLPVASGGNGAITYTLTPPPGLVFDAATRVLSGAPTTAAGATMYTYTAGDTDGSAAGTDEVSLMFSITVEADTAPTFGGATDDARTYTAGLLIEPLTLPVATGGNGAITYTLTTPPVGLTFDAATRVLSGTPTTVAAATDLAYRAGDSDGSTAGTDEVTLMLSITIEANTAPTFSVASIPNQSYLEGSLITPLTLPVASRRQRPRPHHLFAGG